MGKYQTQKKYTSRTQKITRKLKGGSPRVPDPGNEFPHDYYDDDFDQTTSFGAPAAAQSVSPMPQTPEEIFGTLKNNLDKRFKFLRPEISDYFSSGKQGEILDKFRTIAGISDINTYIGKSKSNIEEIDNFMNKPDDIISSTYITFFGSHSCVSDETIPKFCVVPEKTIICFMAPLDYLVLRHNKLGDNNPFNYCNFFMNLDRDSYIKIFQNREKLRDEKNHFKITNNTKLCYYINAFKESSWYYPGQVYPNLTLYNYNNEVLKYQDQVIPYEHFSFLDLPSDTSPRVKLTPINDPSTEPNKFRGKEEMITFCKRNPQKTQLVYNFNDLVNFRRYDTYKEYKIIFVGSCRSMRLGKKEIEQLMDLEILVNHMNRLIIKKITDSSYKTVGLKIPIPMYSTESTQLYYLGLTSEKFELSKCNINPNYDGKTPILQKMFSKITLGEIINEDDKLYLSTLSNRQIFLFMDKIINTIGLIPKEVLDGITTNFFGNKINLLLKKLKRYLPSIKNIYPQQANPNDLTLIQETRFLSYLLQWLPQLDIDSKKKALYKAISAKFPAYEPRSEYEPSILEYDPSLFERSPHIRPELDLEKLKSVNIIKYYGNLITSKDISILRQVLLRNYYELIFMDSHIKFQNFNGTNLNRIFRIEANNPSDLTSLQIMLPNLQHIYFSYSGGKHPGNETIPNFQNLKSLTLRGEIFTELKLPGCPNLRDLVLIDFYIYLQSIIQVEICQKLILDRVSFQGQCNIQGKIRHLEFYNIDFQPTIPLNIQSVSGEIFFKNCNFTINMILDLAARYNIVIGPDNSIKYQADQRIDQYRHHPRITFL